MKNRIRKGIGFAVLAMMLCTAFSINVDAAVETTFNPDAAKTGYHLEVAASFSCVHSDTDTNKVVSCELSGLNRSREEMSKAVRNNLSAPLNFSTRTPTGRGSDKVSSLTLYATVPEMGAMELAGSYLCDDGYAAYAYYRHYFSRCQTTGKNYFVASEHAWLGCARGDIGKNEYHPHAYTHVITKYKFVPNEYKIAFKGNGADSGSMKKQKVSYDETFNLRANTFKRKGYAFSGWNTKADGSGTAYKDKQSLKNLTTKKDATITLYAQWAPNTIKIRYHANGGEAAKGYTLKNQIVQKDGKTFLKEINYETATINLSNVGSLLTRPGYNIDSAKAWSIESADGTKVSQESVNLPNALKQLMEDKTGQTVTLYANWKANKGYYQFNANSGSIPNEAGLPAGVHLQNGTTPKYYKLDRIGAVFSSEHSGTGYEILRKSLSYNTTAASLNLTNVGTFGIKKLGYHMREGAEWNTKADGQGTAFDQDADTKATLDKMRSALQLSEKDGMSLILYAQWDTNGYTVKYDGNGAAMGSMEDQKVKYGQTFQLQKNTFGREGYLFQGWNLKADGTGTVYGNQEKVSNLTTENNGVVTLYAQWKAITYNIHFDGNEATEGTMEDIENVSFGQEVVLPENSFIRETEQGKSLFTGWSMVPDVFESEFADGQTVKNLALENGATVVLYAVWDDCPLIESCDRFFTLAAARAGRITEDELLRTAAAADREDQSLEKRTATQIEEKGILRSLSLYGYAKEDFLTMEDSGSVSVIYKAVDHMGNTVYEMAKVYITNTEPENSQEIRFPRYINEKYYGVSEEEGGLSRDSVWRVNPAYSNKLKQAFHCKKMDTPKRNYKFSREKVLEMQKFIEEYGYGNVQKENALQEFYHRFLQ